MSRLTRSNAASGLAAVITVVAIIATVIHVRGTEAAPKIPRAATVDAAAQVTPRATSLPLAAVTPGSGRSSTSGPVTPTPGIVTPPPTPCGLGNFVFTIATDKPSYRSGETVLVSMAVTYKGSRCEYGGECIPFGIVRDTSKREIRTTMAPVQCGEFPRITLTDGARLQERYPWNQQPLNAEGTATTGQEVARGSYTIIADWHSIGQSQPVAVELVP